ncbi:MAG TPA: cytidylate kinase-like family protein [candidate division Zixibacteria bacterium]|nr:cytidylate kinase-like family protein [candidate division Zixibacteria bacterium]MDD4916866.1 cytidylate kinase-like family protein [candidate division Zixibacteria bacterium]MDM7971454.1 cytidylate kinase-like family protein [candidate division Zixibacteria bacterium]HOD65132.1 cytidylate kinase-like family protein [candidate division Zixibacteria bacterium]HOZ07079.1 cytidylate kinase-like family protein [candidate division Zixibacteria bacterium]
MTSVEALINRQFMRWEREQLRRQEQEPPAAAVPPIITVSRQTGSRGSYFASRLALALDYQRIHREVIDAVCASSGYCRRIVESLDERYRSNLELLIESALSGTGIDRSDFTRQLYRVVLSIARLGGVVLIGRGANFILGPRHGFHVRFIAPRERRVRNLVAYKGTTMIEASEMIDLSDRRRREFVRKIFGAEIDDPSYYDMIINADCIDIEELVEAVAIAYRGKCSKLANLGNDIP